MEKMKCSHCNNNFEDKNLQLSHDVPKYSFNDKKEADKFGRHYLCKDCHDIYERLAFAIFAKNVPEEIRIKARQSVKEFSKRWFNDG
jgi:hypothetical protein